MQLWTNVVAVNNNELKHPFLGYYDETALHLSSIKAHRTPAKEMVRNQKTRTVNMIISNSPDDLEVLKASLTIDDRTADQNGA